MPSGSWNDAALDLSKLTYSEETYPGLPSRDLALGESADGKFIVGLWEASKGQTSYTQDGEEFGSVVAGYARIEVEGEAAMEIGPGDVFFLPDGRRVHWTVPDGIRKFYSVRLNG